MTQYYHPAPPKRGEILHKWQFIAGAIGKDAPDTVMFVRSSLWAEFIAELNGRIRDDQKVAPAFREAMVENKFATPANCQRVRIGRNFTVANAGTDDQAIVDMVNAQAESRTKFRWTVDNMAQRMAAEKKPDIEVPTDFKPEEAIEVPPEMLTKDAG